MIWQGRTCKVEDGIGMLSAVGESNNWDFFPSPASAEQAVAIALPGEIDPNETEPGWVFGKVAALEIVDDERLRIIGSDGLRWLLIGNPADGGRIEREPQPKE